jgi:NADPH:quinone reductase
MSRYLFRVLGAEAAGTVEQVGEGADPALIGKRVVMVTGGVGSYAEYVAVNQGMTAVIPDGLSSIDAVAGAGAGAMALGLAQIGALGGGETVLIEGGSGKIGGYLIQRAKQLGAGKIIATASTPSGQQRARGLGAAVIADHSQPDWPAQLHDQLGDTTVDVAFDLAGGAIPVQLLDLLTPSTGRLVLYGTLTTDPATLDGNTVRERGVRVIGCGGPGWFTNILGVQYPAFLDAAATGQLAAPPVETVLPLAQAADAHRLIDQQRPSARIILTPGDQSAV